MYHIFHATGPDKFSEVEIQPREYVGFVEADSLEDAFIKSQNQENPWNPVNPCRSTSVGDVIQNDDGEFHMVLGVGFRLLFTRVNIPHFQIFYQLFLV
jgi:hypothetical protein